MATATKKTAKGMNVSCPECHESGTITIDLNDLQAGCTCDSCSETFTPAQAIATLTAELARWQAIQNWIEAAPIE